MARKIFIPANEPEDGVVFSGPIVVGTGLTESIGSDDHPFEVVAVKDQKHITVRRLDHERAPNAVDYSNDWVLISDDDNPVRELVKWGDLWYWIRPFGDKNRRTKAYVHFGRARYYYDYEF